MKFAILTALALALPSYSALTKGYIHIRGGNLAKAIPISTEFDDFDGDIYGSETAPALLVQMDLEKAQTTETNIEILNGAWADLYPYLGISTYYWYSWSPAPTLKILNAGKTDSPTLVRKENALSACSPNPMDGLPYQASAIWKYEPESGRVLPTYLLPNGTRYPASIQGGVSEGIVYFNLYGNGVQNPAQELEFFFVPA